jgi:hypothetical protein
MKKKSLVIGHWSLASLSLGGHSAAPSLIVIRWSLSSKKSKIANVRLANRIAAKQPNDVQLVGLMTT